MKEYTHASARLTVSGVPSDMTISYKSGLALEAVILLAVSVVPIAGTLLPVIYKGGPYLLAAFLLGFAVVCYRALAFALDRTTVRAAGGLLTVRHGPLPWRRRVELKPGEVGQFLYGKGRGARGAVGVALRDGRRVSLLSGVLRDEEAEAAIRALRGWLEAAGGHEVFVPEASGGDARAAKRRRKQATAPSGVSFTSDQSGHTIVYKWSPGRGWVSVIFAWLVSEFMLVPLHLEAARFWVDFSLIDYPTFLIASLFLGYGAALALFNRTTTRITDTTFSVRRGPLPCFWPGDYEGPIEDIHQVRYSCHDGGFRGGDRYCYVYVVAGDGTRLDLSAGRMDYPDSGGRQFNLFTVGGDDLASELGTRVLGWIDEEQRKQVGPRNSAGERLRLVERSWAPPDRARRLKLMLCFVAFLGGAAVLMAGAEHLAASYRPARRARRHREIYRQFLERLRSPENYAVAVPLGWVTYEGHFQEPLDVTDQGQEVSLYPGLKKTFRGSRGGRLEVEGLEAALVTGTPCGRGRFFIFPLNRAALTRGAGGAVSADTPAVKMAGVYERRVQDDAGGEWVCVREDPRLSVNSQ